MFNLFKRKKDGSNGSVTVMVTLIMIPTMVVTGFMVDLARLKLYGNQALMTADNYGEAVLSVYDNLLKDLYGLFAVSQSTEGTKALDELSEYITSSFDPNDNTISWSHLNTLLSQTTYSGFMPYSSAEVELSKENCSEANLANSSVLYTQIGDFMKFRIAQTLTGDTGDTILKAVQEINSMEENAEVLDAKEDFDEKADELLESAQGYYEYIKGFKSYMDFLKNVSTQRNKAVEAINKFVASDSYLRYKAYYGNKSSIDAAVKHSNNLKKGETLTDSELELIAVYNDWASDANATKSKIEDKFDEIINTYKESLNAEPVDFDNYNSKYDKLEYVTDAVVKNYEELQSERAELEKKLEDPEVSDSLKEGIREEIELIDDLFTVNGKFSSDNYVKATKYVSDGRATNGELKKVANDNLSRFKEIKKAYVDLTTPPQYAEKVNSELYRNYYYFYDYPACKEMYDNLVNTFETDGNDGGAKKKKSEAKTALKNAEKEVPESESSDARDIPTSFKMGTDGEPTEFKLTKMVGSALDMFTDNNLMGVGNTLLLKFYTVQYDFAMFSNRTTNVQKETNSDGEEVKAASLTGYELSKKINYLYKAELEYLFGGYNDSDKNLTSARNHILAFRAIVNLTATYTVKPIHKSIQTISKAAAAINPLLGISVAAALRLAVAGIETAEDWKELKDGKGVVLIKTKLEDMTACDKYKSLIGMKESSSGQSSGFKLDYEQYLMVMLLFMTTVEEIAERTANLISLNVNTVEQKIGETGTLSKLTFTMENAVTAVNATCKVHLDFLIMPESMAKIFMGDDYGNVETYSKNQYGFTVTRGY